MRDKEKLKISLRKGTEDDIEDIARLEPIIFQDPWSEEMVRSDVTNRISTYIIAEIEKEKGQREIAGYIGYWLIQHECQINNVAVIPHFQRRGIGGAMLSEVLKETEEKGACEWILEVRKNNLPAITIYEKHGFIKIGIRGNYYENGEDAIIMKRTRTEDKGLIVLAIESSCDETCAAVVRSGREVLSNIISSQIEIHTQYGGVVPEIASRHHLTNINGVIGKALSDAKCNFEDVNLIAVTNGPGLIGALVIGVAAAKGISLATGIPLIGVNHMYGHISGNFITYPELEPPFICLIVSGGHTSLVKMTGYTHAEVLGSTRDDAVGEAYDKVARVIGLGYPGGPKIDNVAREGNPEAIYFKRVYLEKDSLDFSFSGIKTAVLNYVSQERQAGRKLEIPDIAAGFQEAVVEVLVEKSVSAVKKSGEDKLVLAGGVAANSRLRKAFTERCESDGIKLYLPELGLCTDNAAMIASAAYYKYLESGHDDLQLDAFSDLEF